MIFRLRGKIYSSGDTDAVNVFYVFLVCLHWEINCIYICWYRLSLICNIIMSANMQVGIIYVHLL